MTRSTLTGRNLPEIRNVLDVARQLIEGGGWSQHTPAVGLDGAELEEFSASYSRYYSPKFRPDRDSTDDALRILAEVVYGDEIPEGIPPSNVVANWNNRAGSQAEIIEAFDAAIRVVDTMLKAEADRG